MYRAIVNGSSDLLTAQDVLDHIEYWRSTSRAFPHRGFRLWLAPKEECVLEINSFSDPECSASSDTAGNCYRHIPVACPASSSGG